MVQGGGFTANMQQKPVGMGIKNEATNGLKNSRGTLAMARTNVVDSATSQFFINTGRNNGFLNNSGITPEKYGYAVFGKLTGGMDVLEKIDGVDTGTSGPYGDVPKTPIEILSITVQ